MNSTTESLTGIRYRVSSGIAHITLARPDASNAIDLPTAQSLDSAVESAAADPAVRVLVLEAEGTRFCSGGDVAAIASAEDKPAAVRELAETLDMALRRLDSLDKPVIAAVQGTVAGAGLGVLLACDLVIAARSAKLVTAYTSIGITPDCGVSWLLPRAVGQQRALELILTGRPLTSEEAQSWGLVTRVVDDSDVAAVAQEVADTLAASSVFAMGNARRLVRSSWTSSREESSRDEVRTVAEAIGQGSM